MRTNKRALGGLVAVVLAALSVTACDPYMAANTAAPVVLGVTMIDTEFWEVPPVNNLGCTKQYPEPDQTWANATFPGLCNPANIDFGIPTVCPVGCFPQRTGPGYAPFYTGNLGGSYKTAAGGNFTYQLASTYTLTGVNGTYDDAFWGVTFVYGQIRILFNKLLDPATVQPNPAVAQPPSGATALKVFRNNVDVTASHAVWYDPTSDTEYWGASINVTNPATGTLVAGATYHIVGTVADQQGNSANVDVTVSMAP